MIPGDQPLTSAGYWDEVWEGISLPALVLPGVQWQYALAREFRKRLPRGPEVRVFEVGCAPGRWLVWFRHELGCQVAGCDSSPRGIHLTRENLRLNNVRGEVYQADILTDSVGAHGFDVVLSLGVIEHFEQPRGIIRRHMELVKPGGYLVIEVPNMAGWLNHWLLRIAAMDDLLSAHNLKVMNRSFFRRVALDFGLEITFLGYIGGFDPGLFVYNYPYRVHGKRRVLLELWRRRHFSIPALWVFERVFRAARAVSTRFNAPCCSHMLMGIFRLPG